MSFTANNLKSKGYAEVRPGVWEIPKFLPPTGDPETVHAPVDRERDLHDLIECDLINRRFYYVHSRTDRPTTTALGVTDFIIAAPNRITLWIEVKRPGGKLTKEQTVTKHVLTALSHLHFVVFSFEEYLKIVNLQNMSDKPRELQKVVCNQAGHKCPEECPHLRPHEPIPENYTGGTIDECHETEGQCGHRSDQPMCKCVPV